MTGWIAFTFGVLLGILLFPGATVVLLAAVLKLLGMHICPGHDEKTHITRP